MILYDDKYLYIKPENMINLIKTLGAIEYIIYITVIAYAYEFPDGVEEKILFKSLGTRTAAETAALEHLINKGYIQRIHNLIKLVK